MKKKRKTREERFYEAVGKITILAIAGSIFGLFIVYALANCTIVK